MRISDWSSDVCSSDLRRRAGRPECRSSPSRLRPLPPRLRQQSRPESAAGSKGRADRGGACITQALSQSGPDPHCLAPLGLATLLVVVDFLEVGVDHALVAALGAFACRSIPRRTAFAGGRLPLLVERLADLQVRTPVL